MRQGIMREGIMRQGIMRQGIMDADNSAGMLYAESCFDIVNSLYCLLADHTAHNCRASFCGKFCPPGLAQGAIAFSYEV